MLKHRVIPCLLMKNGGLVKTQKFAKPKYVGDPVNAIRIFNDKEVDELMLLDINASKDGKSPDFDLIEQIAGECFMPLSYGGGIKTLDQARRLFKMGVEKVCLQSSTFVNKKLITEIADLYGSQSVIISIDIKKNWLGKYQLYDASTGKVLKKSWEEHLKEVVAAGAGEILVNAVDKDGLLEGMDFDLIQKAASQISVPLIAVGGVGTMDDILSAVKCGASAVAAGAFFVFHGPHRAVLITYPKYEELENLFTKV